MRMRRQANVEPIPGYRLLEPLGKGGFGEVWKCEAPGGLLKAIKFLDGHGRRLGEDPAKAHQELAALRHIKMIRHPFLLSVERVEVVEGDLVIVMELADQSLHDLFRRHRAEGQPGIPRAELLGYLAEAAEVLDLLSQGHGLQHLDVKPQNLFLFGQHVKVADFGLVAWLAERQEGTSPPVALTCIDPLYTSPEVFLGKFTLSCDQYSLAVTYQELLTGTFPFGGNLMGCFPEDNLHGTPDLCPLPTEDQPVVARALAKEPRERFPSCLAFVQALGRAEAEVSTRERLRVRTTRCAIGRSGLLGQGERPGNRAARRAATQIRSAGPALAQGGPAPARPTACSLAGLLVPGFRLRTCLYHSSTIESWIGQDPHGRRRLLTVMGVGELPDPSQAPARALDRDKLLAWLETLQHDSLPPAVVFPAGSHHVAHVTDVPERTLADRFRECQVSGLVGIPREELLGYLRQAADALDELYHTYHLRHLSLLPRKLLLVGGQVVFQDFGVTELLLLAGGGWLPDLNLRYLPPELHEGLIHRSCDQFTLALIYQRLLTGTHPFDRHLRAGGILAEDCTPDLSPLPSADRPFVRQAVSARPEHRFRSCGEFVSALEVAGAVPAGGGLR
jgi:serine/threonine protein kinase